MVTVYEAAEGVLIKREGPVAITPAVVWIELLIPTKDEEESVEPALAISVPTREEMSEIEASSRLYQERGGDGGGPAPAGFAVRRAGRHAHHLHPGRQPPRHRALRRATRLLDLPRPRAK